MDKSLNKLLLSSNDQIEVVSIGNQNLLLLLSIAIITLFTIFIIYIVCNYYYYTILHLLLLGITNQRETTIIWNKLTGKPYHNAIVWNGITLLYSHIIILYNFHY